MKKKTPRMVLAFLATALLLLCLIVLLPPDLALAEEFAGHGLGSTGGVSGLGALSSDLPALIGSIINALLGLVGVIFLVLMIYAGFLWMTAGGNEEQVKKARTLIFSAIAGMAIIFAAYAITVFVVDTLAPPGTGTAPESDTVTGDDSLEDLMEGAIDEECTGAYCADLEGI